MATYKSFNIQKELMRQINESILRQMDEVQESIISHIDESSEAIVRQVQAGLREVKKSTVDKVNELDKKREELMKVCSNISKFLRKEKKRNIEQFKVKN